MIIFEVKSVLGKKIRLTKEILNQILDKHLEIHKGDHETIKLTLTDADIVVADKYDETVFIYQKLFTRTRYGPKFFNVVVKHLNSDGFVITLYPSNKIKQGEIVWTKS